MRHVYLHSEDLDGWLAEPNFPLAAEVVSFLSSVQGLKCEEADGTHEVQLVLNSGKPAEYLLAQARRFGGEYVICGNGVGWQHVDGTLQRVLPPGDEWRRLRECLGITAEARDVVTVRLPHGSVTAALEEKRDSLGDLAISFFPEPGPVAHRWRFGPGIDRHLFAEGLRRIIEEHGLPLAVPPPHGDGAVDVLPLVEGRPAGKWLLERIAPLLFPGAQIHLTHAGDGLNDISAMEALSVLPMTSADCPQCLELVRARSGVIASFAAPGLAVAECYLRLAERNWYGPLSQAIGNKCRTALGDS